MDVSNILIAPDLYHPDIDEFFRTHFMFHEHYDYAEHLNIFNNFGAKSVLYAASGLFKIYFNNMSNQDIFTGYLPHHAVLTSHYPNSQLSGSGELFSVTLDDYSVFLAEHPELLSRALSMSGTFFSYNNVLRHDTTFQSSKLRVYSFILYMAKSFGTPDAENPSQITMAYPPTNADIASFFSIHSNNVSSFMKSLEREGYIDRSRRSLIVYDIDKLSALIASMN